MTRRPKARRDFILDSGGLSYLAESAHRTAVWLDRISSNYEEPAIVVPVPVLTECLTGSPRRDAPTNQLLAKLGAAAGDEGHLLLLSPAAASRAAALRTRAMTAASERKHPISAIDAQVVALAEERSFLCAVTILTSDPDDIQRLVDLTGRPNIAVRAV
jgi:hypothetical protein